MMSVLYRAKRILSTIIPLLVYIQLIAFLTNMLTVSFLGKELATQINGGNIALPTFYYNIVAITLLVILHKFNKIRKQNNVDSSTNNTP